LEKGKEVKKMRKRISLLFVALMLALTMSLGGVAFAKQAETGPQGSGCTTTHQGNSTNSPVVSSNHGQGGGSAC
jgi:hypothetical protein